MRAFGQVGPCGRCAGSMRILGRVRVCCFLTVSGLVSVTCEFEIIAWVRVFRLLPLSSVGAARAQTDRDTDRQ